MNHNLLRFLTDFGENIKKIIASVPGRLPGWCGECNLWLSFARQKQLTWCNVTLNQAGSGKKLKTINRQASQVLNPSGKVILIFQLFDCEQVSAISAPEQGCQIFLGTNYQNGEKYTKLQQNIPNGHNIFPMALK
jgi:hypothetical protein